MFASTVVGWRGHFHHDEGSPPCLALSVTLTERAQARKEITDQGIEQNLIYVRRWVFSLSLSLSLGSDGSHRTGKEAKLISVGSCTGNFVACPLPTATEEGARASRGGKEE